MCTFGALVGILALSVLDYYRPDLSARLLPVGAVAIFMLAELLHQISMVQSTYLRAFKKEPFLWVSLGTGATIALSNVILIRPLGGYSAALSYLIGISLALVWGTIIFVKCRRDWTFPRAEY